MSKKFNITFKNINNYSKKFNKKKTNKMLKHYQQIKKIVDVVGYLRF